MLKAKSSEMIFFFCILYYFICWSFFCKYGIMNWNLQSSHIIHRKILNLVIGDNLHGIKNHYTISLILTQTSHESNLNKYLTFFTFTLNTYNFCSCIFFFEIFYLLLLNASFSYRLMHFITSFVLLADFLFVNVFIHLLYAVFSLLLILFWPLCFRYENCVWAVFGLRGE